eukprot:1196116-Prorocentrum_minimum.AAC.3
MVSESPTSTKYNASWIVASGLHLSPVARRPPRPEDDFLVRHKLLGVQFRVKQLMDQRVAAHGDKKAMLQQLKHLDEDRAELTQREQQLDRAARKLKELGERAHDAPIDKFDRPFEGMNTKPSSGKPSLQMFYVTHSGNWLWESTLGRLGVL